MTHETISALTRSLCHWVPPDGSIVLSHDVAVIHCGTNFQYDSGPFHYDNKIKDSLNRI